MRAVHVLYIVTDMNRQDVTTTTEEREAAAHVADFVEQTLIWKRRRGSPAERAAARRLRDRLAPVLSRFKANPPPLARAS